MQGRQRPLFGSFGEAIIIVRDQIMLDGIELAAVDRFRFKAHMPSRASAVRELLKRGLAAEGFLTAAVGTKSSDYGVVGEMPED